MTTKWRDKAVTPDSYEDIVQLSRLARRARNLTVEFAWEFSESDLRHLRAAVYFWGKPTTGRFKRFHSRVLEAINAALGEADSICYLKPYRPHKTDSDCKVNPMEGSDRFLFEGFATFASIFGYGQGATTTDEGIRSRLGDEVRGKLVRALNELGWDIQRLRDPKLVAAANAVYGVGGAAASGGKVPMADETISIDVKFHGPFGASDQGSHRCIFHDLISRKRGVYLWTIPVGEEEWVSYVGETRVSFQKRLSQHIAKILSGQYWIPDAGELARGDVRNSAWRSGSRGYGTSVPDFLSRYESLAPQIKAYLELLRFHVAPLDANKHELRQVEALIGRYYESHSNRRLSDFFGAGGRYARPIPHTKAVRCTVSSEAHIAGLPSELPAPLL